MSGGFFKPQFIVPFLLEHRVFIRIMTKKTIHLILTYFIAAVWIVNGLFCKILNLTPRHQEIVASILGAEYSSLLTILIGGAELVMALWILSKIKSRLNTIVQIVVVASMNVIEFIRVPDLLLWGKLNALFAFLFILVVYYNEFYGNEKLAQ
jgi:DoxX-like family